MIISKNQIVELLKLALEISQNAYEEIKENISLKDTLFVKPQFEILVDEDAKKFRTKGLILNVSYFRKKTTSQQSLNLRENKNFQTIAEVWDSKKSKIFNTSDALEQFCNNIIAEHQIEYGFLCPHFQSYLEKYADALLYAVENGSYPIHFLIFFKDLWINRSQTILKPFQGFQDALPQMWIRRPVFEDYPKGYSLGQRSIDNLQIRVMQQTALVEFFWYDKHPPTISPSIECQTFIHSLENIFLLIDKTSVRMTEFRASSGYTGGWLSIFDSSPNRCFIIEGLERKLKWVGNLMLPIIMGLGSGSDEIKRSFKYYQNSLFRSLGVESRIALSIAGLESLYNSDKSASKIFFLRVARLLSYFNMDPLEVKKNLKKAYNIRSQNAHASKTKKEGIQDLIELSENIDEYLRLSILSFKHLIDIGEINKNVINEIDNSCCTLVASKFFEGFLSDIKKALFNSTSDLEKS